MHALSGNTINRIDDIAGIRVVIAHKGGIIHYLSYSFPGKYNILHRDGNTILLNQ
jgi:hypothetical protein